MVASDTFAVLTGTDAVVRLDGVTKEYRDGDQVARAVDGVDLAIGPGEMVAVTGRSGSGKSTLLNLAGTLEQPSAGSVTIEGRSTVGLGRGDLAALRRRSIGFVFQNLNLMPTLTAAENVALPLEFDRVKVGPARDAADTALERVGLADKGDRFPDQLSGGEQQRVAIARAIVGPRRMILADEPTAALDELTARHIMRLLVELADEGAAVMVATHDHELAAHAMQVVRLRDGRVDQVTARPCSPASPAELLS